ncbi:MAG: hypothetical protein ACERIH_09450 [Labilibaculum antarcticum]
MDMIEKKWDRFLLTDKVTGELTARGIKIIKNKPMERYGTLTNCRVSYSIYDQTGRLLLQVLLFLLMANLVHIAECNTKSK